ncbi:MAG: response regulator [Chthonomonas sp.]|nr:response regulator [Chthonomonas sp.]
MPTALVIDDEDAVLSSIKRRLERAGLTVTAASSAEEGMRLLNEAEHSFDVIITDMSIETPDSGMRVLNSAFERDLFAEVLVMTAYGNVANAVECMRRGAFDYVEKNMPGVDVYELLAMKVENALERRRQDMRTIERWERVAKAVSKQ